MAKSSRGIFLTADVGAATTKVSYIDCSGDTPSLGAVTQVPTTWTPEDTDVMVGVLHALRLLQRELGRPLVSDSKPILGSSDPQIGADAFVVTTSAAGGMRLLCLGLVRMMTAESAERAALGAGATVSAVIAADDGRSLQERLEIIRRSCADMILMAGGTDHGTVEHVLAVAEYLEAARPRPRLGDDVKIPIIFAGNVGARDSVASLLNSVGDVHTVDNLRPTLDRENLDSVRELISSFYLDHVARRTPGYENLLFWSGGKLEPTPSAEARVLRAMAKGFDVNVLGVDLGGSTADVFSVMKGVFNRSVSSEVGLGASAVGVLKKVGAERIRRWCRNPVEVRDIENWIMNHALRPATVATEPEEMEILSGLTRESLGIAFEEHRDLVVSLRGIKQYRTFDDTFEQSKTGYTLVESSRLDVIIGTGSILSADVEDAEVLLAMLDGIQPVGISRFYVDRYGLMSHVGALMDRVAGIEQKYFHEWLTPIGTVVAPGGDVWGREGSPVAEMRLTFDDGDSQGRILRVGEMDVVPLGRGEVVRVDITPRKNYDLGDGPGTRVSAYVRGGDIGLIIDVRGRPLKLPETDSARRSALLRWRSAVGLKEGGEGMASVGQS
ncbi:MAG: glutamate mutase L [Clostridia bacterium]